MTFFEEIKKETKRRKSLFIVFFLVFFPLVSFFIIRAVSQEEEIKDENKVIEEVEPYPVLRDREEEGKDPNIKGSAALSIYWDGNSEKILYKENPDKPLPIASISKLMTALVVLEDYDLDAPVGIAEKEIITRSEFRDFRAFKETKVEEMVYPMVIESNNSAAFALALAGERFFDDISNEPVKGFVEKMNNKAREIGLKKTNFVNPSGLDGRSGEYNLSTAREITEFSKYLLSNTDIFKISQMPSYRLYSPDGAIYYESLNTNDFLHSKEEDWQERIVGGKTGWTHAAFGCLLLVLESPSHEGYIINIVLGTEDRFHEMGKMVDYIHNAYEF